MASSISSYSKNTEDLIIRRLSEGFSYPEILKELQLKKLYSGNYNSFKSFARALKTRRGLIENQKDFKEIDKKILK